MFVDIVMYHESFIEPKDSSHLVLVLGADQEDDKMFGDFERSGNGDYLYDDFCWQAAQNKWEIHPTDKALAELQDDCGWADYAVEIRPKVYQLS
jgi:hypothetical protein